MNTALAITDSAAGTIRRYERVNGMVIRTHKAEAEEAEGRPYTFAAEFVRLFLRGIGEFYCRGPAPIPGGDNPSGAPAAVRAAA